jgi:hypothetical protein
VILLFLWPHPLRAQSDQPVDVGLQEETGITLMILDIDARDKQGRLLPGLVEEDFLLFLGPTPWEIYAVDDLCPCSASPDEASPAHVEVGEISSTTTQDPPGSGLVSTAPPLPANPQLQQRFILYFDFSQMRLDGRDRAFVASRRWLTETKRPQDWVEMISYVSHGGLRRMMPFTQDREALLTVLNDAENDLAYVDDYPARFQYRKKECERSGRITCMAHAMQEYSHGQRSLRVFRQFLSSLGSMPGRKEMLYFSQNNVIYPARLYLGKGGDFVVGDNRQLVEEVGAAATGSGTRIHALNTDAHRGFGGLISDLSVNFGFNLADFTGGTYSQASSDLAILMDRPVRECSCRYRLSFRPPESTRNKMLNARVLIRGKRLPYSFRSEYLTRPQRLLREAVAMLDFPDSRRDFPVAVSLMPTKRTGKGWDVTASVLVKLDALSLMETPDGPQAELDVAAVFYRHFQQGGGKAHEMTGGTSIRLKQPGELEEWLVHQTQFTGLSGGEYRLTGFIRNASMAQYGGDDVMISLPKVALGALVGPFMYQPDRPYFISELPELKKGDAPVPHPATRSRGALPTATDIPQGQEVLFLTWSCNPRKEPVVLDETSMVRHILREGVKLDTLTAPHFLAAEENCLKLIDLLDTTHLSTGTYSYLVRKDDERDGADLNRDEFSGEIEFRVVPAEVPASRESTPQIEAKAPGQ